MARKPILCIVMAMMLLTPAAYAAVGDLDKPDISLTPYGGATLWSDEIGLDDGTIFGGRGAVHLARWLSLEGSLGWSRTNELATAAGLDVRHASLGLVLDILPRAMINPYLLGSWGQFDVSGDALPREWSLNGWEAGAGFKIRLGGDHVNRVNLRLEARDVMSDLASSFGNDGAQTNNLILSAGLQFHFGRGSRDGDGDGIRDRDDRCDDTPSGAEVDLRGCPSDSDGDGVFDGIDQCPDTAKGLPVNQAGCPIDGDGDGVVDGIDKCPDTPAGAVVDATGCPRDSDGDGMLDGLDMCADTPFGAIVDERGCPVDSDDDGVYDGIDQCPDTPANLLVDGEGCPITVTETDTQLLDTGMIRTSEIRFRSGSSTLQTNDTTKLDEIGTTLTHWPELNIEIGGFTDSQGSEDNNQRLSEQRAQAVLDYLVAKFPGINVAQYTVRGYGEASPIADNATAAGRAANRRVEFKVLNSEVIKRVIKNQKLLER